MLGQEITDPLEECPQFFVGNFKAKASFTNYEIPKEDWYEATGLITACDMHGRLQIGTDDQWTMGMYCTLIARPISDITDEEIVEFENKRANPRLTFAEDSYSDDQIKQMRVEAVQWHDLGITANRMRFYLSKGIYPFSKDHLSDGTVIDSTTL